MPSLPSTLLLASASLALLGSSAHSAQSAVDLGLAAQYVVLSKAGISTTGTTFVVGNMAVSPISAIAITGFPLTLDASGTFATSPLVEGKIYAATYAPPTPAILTTVISNMETAYTDAAGRTTPDTTELGSGILDGVTLPPGLHKWGTDFLLTSSMTFAGGPQDVWILQIAQDLDLGTGARVNLEGGALAANIFWQVGGQATLGTTSHFAGILLSQSSIAARTGATVDGRLFAQTAVTLDANQVVAPVSGSNLVLAIESIVRAPDGRVTLKVRETPGRELTMQHSHDLVNWTTFLITTPDTSQLTVIHQSELDDPHHFYRAMYP